MPLMEQLEHLKFVKGLNISGSGGGKTGALACLAREGYTLVIYDFDRGTQILMDEKVLPPQYRKNVYITEYLDDVMATPSGPKFKETPKAWMNFLRDLETHPDLGPTSKFTDKHIIVIDSLTFSGKAALRYVLNINGRLNQQPWIGDWGQAIDMQENLCAILYSKAIPCHVIINAHITYIGGGEHTDLIMAMQEVKKDLAKTEGSDTKAAEAGLAQAIATMAPTITPDKGFPSALGKVLPPKIGRYFNTMVSMKVLGSGAAERRVMITRSEPNLDLKVPFPSKIQNNLPIDSAWLQIFKAVHGQSPAARGDA